MDKLSNSGVLVTAVQVNAPDDGFQLISTDNPHVPQQRGARSDATEPEGNVMNSAHS